LLKKLGGRALVNVAGIRQLPFWSVERDRLPRVVVDFDAKREIKARGLKAEIETASTGVQGNGSSARAGGPSFHAEVLASRRSPGG
jgi:hypothetical protein